MVLHWFSHTPRFAAEGGGGGGAAPTGGASATGGDPGRSNAATPLTPGEPPAAPSGDRVFTQAELDRIIQERLAEERARAEKRSAAERKKAEEEAMARNAEWQKLAEQRAAELEQIRAQAEAAARYASALNAELEAEIADWPEEVRSLDPGKDRLDERLAWVIKARALAAKLKSLLAAPRTEAGAQPRPAAPAPANAATGAPRYKFQQPGDVSW